MHYSDVIKFWFKDIEPKQWWIKDPQFDQLIKQRFANLHSQAICGELFGWRETPQGRVAEVIVIDQFSRNIFRDDPRAFYYDPIALVLAQEAIAQGLDQTLSLLEKTALYLPFMHSESLAIHQQAVKLFSAKGLESNLEFEYKHKVIIERFGRYPHRNAILGRKSSPEEIAFLEQPDSSF